MIQTAGITIERTSAARPMPGRINLNGCSCETKKEISGEIKVPKGYLTHDQFVKKCNQEIDDLCIKYGI